MKGLVAGGAGGIGQDIVKRMVDAGYEVTIADLDQERTQTVQRETGASKVCIGDVTTEGGAQRAIEAACGDEPLHALVIATGTSPKKDGYKRPFYEISLEEGSYSPNS